jgi:hypothetical protein
MKASGKSYIMQRIVFLLLGLLGLYVGIEDHNRSHHLFPAAARGKLIAVSGIFAGVVIFLFLRDAVRAIFSKRP